MMYETFCDKLQPYFGRENIQLHYMACDSFVLSIKTQNIFKDSENIEDLFDFSNRDEKHELISNKNKQVVGNFKKESPKNLCRDEFLALGIKAYSFKCNDENTGKLKGIS